MPALNAKTTAKAAALEQKLIGLVSQFRALKSKSKAHLLLEEARTDLVEVSRLLPTGDANVTKLRKALVAVQNNMSGLIDGLAAGEERPVILAGLKTLETRFIPNVRAALDALADKAEAERNTLSPAGLVQSDSALLELSKSTATALQRLQRTVQSKKDKEIDGAMLAASIGHVFTQVDTAYNTTPMGKELDAYAHALVMFARLLNKISRYVEKHNRIARADLVSYDALVVSLNRITTQIERDIHNRNLVLGEEPRLTLHRVLRTKAEDDADTPKDSQGNTLARKPDAFLKQQLAEVKTGKSDLPKTLKGPFSVINAPVVAIFDANDGGRKRDRPEGPGTVQRNFSRTALLDQYGIKYLMLEDYLILQSQRLLAVDMAAVEAAYIAQKKAAGKRASTISAKDRDRALFDYAQGVVNLLNERGSQQFELVSKDHIANPRSKTMVLFWVMPSRILGALQRRGWSKLSRWNLPFDA